MPDCETNLTHPAVKLGKPAAFNLGNFPVVCGGKDASDESHASCYAVTENSWALLGNMSRGRDDFAVIPLARNKFLAYGNLRGFNLHCYIDN